MKIKLKHFWRIRYLAISSTVTVASEDTPNIVPNFAEALATARCPHDGTTSEGRSTVYGKAELLTHHSDGRITVRHL